ncbi:MAG: hypothetical protein KF716_15435 [Anaerolineae bacterium]|nr:hypothetical protein [Anaerolineae bacterium]
MDFGNPHFGLGDLEIVKEITRKPTDHDPEHTLTDDVKRLVNFVSKLAHQNAQPLKPAETVYAGAETVRDANQTSSKRRFIIG